MEASPEFCGECFDELKQQSLTTDFTDATDKSEGGILFRDITIYDSDEYSGMIA